MYGLSVVIGKIRSQSLKLKELKKREVIGTLMVH